ncbi:hypothetical protein Glove_84g61 [Diversispora epigaea]|uniref:Protein kinase domain-containing protein n=1 Tax=Diversispora epigaea TaxID=1348612 RepID=A0A397JBI2_9GLOM|nr:hypothetical protein Glove_84g61 [Diversispora epigaea]
MEWIPYDRFKDVEQIGKGGFGTIHYARWIDGQIFNWDPEIHSFMMVLYYARDGNLREYLKINSNNNNWRQKLKNLWKLSDNLKDIHELDIVH